MRRFAACVSILDENPEDDQALGTLARLYEQQGRHRDRLEIVERRLALRKPKDAERLDLLKQIAKLLEGPLGDATGAGALAEVLERAPPTGKRWRRWNVSWRPAPTPACAWPPRRCWRPIYERAVVTPSWPGSSASTRPDPMPRARLGELMRLAALEEKRLGDTEGALQTTALAIRDALTEPELPELLDAYERLAGPQRLADVTALYREISPDVLDEALKLRLDRTIASAAAGQGDAATAADYYRRILIASPTTTPRWPRSIRSIAATATRRLSTRSSCGVRSWPRSRRSRARCASRSASWQRPSSNASKTRSPPSSGSSRSRLLTGWLPRRSIASTPRPSAGAI